MFIIDALLALLLTCAAVYGMDRWVLSLRERSFTNFDIAPLLWGSTLANLLTATLLLGLAWFVVFRGRRSRFVMISYLVFGLALTSLPFLLTSTPAALTLFSTPEFRILRVTLLYSTPNSRLLLTGTAVAAIGGVGVLRDLGAMRALRTLVR